LSRRAIGASVLRRPVAGCRPDYQRRAMKAVAIPWPKPLPLDPGRKLEGEFCKIVGGVLSPLLANVYLHYAYDLWVRAWRSRHATGDMIVVRYADDTIVGFQHRGDAERFLADLKDRLAKFALELHPDKTRLIAFGRIVAERRRARGEGRPETFDFLGFTHICAAKRGGHGFQLRRKTKRGRKWATIRQIGEALRRMRHDAIDKQGRRLAGMLEGHYAYFAVPTNIEAVLAVRHHAKVRWYLSLRRRSQRRRLTWRRMNVIVERHLPKPRILHPGPEQRFLVRHRRQEPEA
jgi:RNA-directed DNA polymerase